MKTRELINKGINILEKAEVSNGKNEARMLFCHMKNITQSELFLAMEEKVDKDAENEFLGEINKRAKGVPLQYIMRNQEFMGLTFEVNEHVLIPRRETEELVELALEFIGDEEAKVLDMCSGSGAIGVSIAKLSKAKVWCSDISTQAIKLTEKNAKALEVNHKMEFLQGDLFEKIKEDDFDLIVSNPPYIESEEINKLNREVKDFEPMLALDGGSDGLDFYKRIVKEAPNYLKNKGMLALEIGYNQGEDLKKLLEDNGRYTGIKVLKDLSKRDRMVIAYKEA